MSSPRGVNHEKDVKRRSLKKDCRELPKIAPDITKMRGEFFDKGCTDRFAISRAASYQSGSYPPAAKKLAHSVGVKVSQIQQIVFQSPRTVRLATVRSMALSLAKASSIGLESGL